MSYHGGSEMQRLVYMGADPGASGALAVIHDGVHTIRMEETLLDVWCWIKDWTSEYRVVCALEAVHSMPKQGVASSFNFGRSFGNIEAMLVASNAVIHRVTAAKWQGALNCRTQGEKNITKARAQEWFPGVKITHKEADAILLAEYARRTFLNG